VKTPSLIESRITFCSLGCFLFTTNYLYHKSMTFATIVARRLVKEILPKGFASLEGIHKILCGDS
jgi:hypothetical protein